MEFMSLDYFKYFGVLLLLLAIIWLILYVVKNMSQNRMRESAANDDIFNSKNNSLFVQEVLPIDQKSKIVIIGRDDTRHVILIGENHSNLLETVRPSYYEEEAEQIEEVEEVVAESKFMRKEFPHATETDIEDVKITDTDSVSGNDNDQKSLKTNIKSLVEEKKNQD